MRTILNIKFLLIGALALVLHSCVKEEWDMPASDSDKMVSLTIDISTRGAASRAELHEDYNITSLRVVAVDDHGRVEHNKYIDTLITSSPEALYYSFDVVQSDQKLIYVLLNEPEHLTAELNKMSYQSQLTQSTHSITEWLNNRLFIAGESIAEVNRKIPMGGMQSVDASTHKSVLVKVDRVVARVDLYVDKDENAHTTDIEFDSSTTVNVTGLYYNTTLFSSTNTRTPTPSTLASEQDVEISRAVALSLKSDDRATAKHLLSFYMAERTYDVDTPNRVQINLDKIKVANQVKPLDAYITLGSAISSGIDKVRRNYVYRIFATYKGEDQTLEVNGEYAIQDWTLQEVDGDIEGVMISVQDEVVMDWMRLNNSFTAKDIAFGSNRAIDIYVPSSYDKLTGEYTFTRSKFVAVAGASYDLLDLSIHGVANDDNYLRQVPWLTAARITFDNELAGHFDFTYDLVPSSDYIISVPVELHSGNVRKQLTIIYDNGYVPGTLINANDKTDCWDDNIAGVHFAKRGDALHPLTTEEVLMPNALGLYDGDITVEGGTADQYCKSKFGARWYAPNKDQLADIQRHIFELGTSYRYNNASPSIYWSSQADGVANFWSVDFAAGLVEPGAVSAAASESHFVRCITNL